MRHDRGKPVVVPQPAGPRVEPVREHPRAAVAARVLQLQRVVGNRVVGRLLSGRTPPPGRLQAVFGVRNVSFKEADETVESLDIPTSERPPTSLSGGEQGDHTTAWVTIVEGFSRQIVGKDYAGALDAISALTTALTSLPGWSGMAKKTERTDERTALINDIATYKTVANKLFWPQKLRDAAERYLKLRGLVPRSAVKHAQSTGGHGEQAPTDRISTLEHHLATAGGHLSDDEKTQTAADIAQVFDYTPAVRGSAATAADTVAQHLITLKQFFPLVYAEVKGSKLKPWVLGLKDAWGINLRRQGQREFWEDFKAKMHAHRFRTDVSIT